MVNERSSRVLDGILGLTPLRLTLWLVVIAAVLPGLSTDPGKMIAFMDDHQFTNWEEADRISIVRYHELPFWNPYYCGGMASAAAPESGVFAPDYLLRLAFGVLAGRRLAVILFVFLGMEGIYRLCRAVNGSALSGVFAALVFPTFTMLVHSYLDQGWVNFFGFELVPWVILGLVKGTTSMSWRLIGGLALGWIALAAGTYTAPYTGIGVTFVTLALAASCLSRALGAGNASGAREPWNPRELRGLALSAATIAIVGILLAVAKLLPMMLLMRNYPRSFTPVEQNPPMQLLGGYWSVYAPVLLLAVVALFFQDRFARVFFATAALFFVLAMGQFAGWSPGTLMKRLPLVSGLRLPERYMVMFHLFIVLTAARALSNVEDAISRTGKWLWAHVRAPHRRRALETFAAPLVMSGLAAGILFYEGQGTIKAILDAATVPAHSLYAFDPPQRVEQDFKQARGNRRDAHIWPFANRGTLYCFVGIPLPESARLRADLPQEEYPADPSVAKVERLSWSPHSIALKVEAALPTRILVNQNYSPHWTSDVGQVVNADVLLGVDVPQGTHVVTLRYRDRTSLLCLLVSLSTLLTVAVILGRTAMRHGKETFGRYQTLMAPSRLDAEHERHAPGRSSSNVETTSLPKNAPIESNIEPENAPTSSDRADMEKPS